MPIIDDYFIELLELERTPVVDKLMEIIIDQRKTIEELKKEIASLKKKPKRPKIRPNTLPVIKQPKVKKIDESKKTAKKKITYHEEVTIQPNYDTRGCRFKGYRYYHAQDISIELKNTKFKLARWQTRTGEYLPVYLPDAYEGYHFGPTLRAYILHQYHHQGVTQNLILAQLREWGIVISPGELNLLLVHKKDEYHKEKKEIFRRGVSLAHYLHVDDTGARHQGKNGICTHIGNEYFACFFTTRYKNRTNFLKILHSASRNPLEFNRDLVDELRKNGLDSSAYWKFCNYLEQPDSERDFYQVEDFINYLKYLNADQNTISLGLQLALKASLKNNPGFPKKLTIMSDDAGQFQNTGYTNALCWIHAERKLKDLIPVNIEQRRHLESALEAFWDIYRMLLAYKNKPDKAHKRIIMAEFQKMVAPRGNYHLLNKVLKKFKSQKSQLLRALIQPEVPLHNNLSERDIREFVKRRKVSGGTRSDAGRDCRDTFASLKKTCKKLNVSFWSYLLARETKNSSFGRLESSIPSRYYTEQNRSHFS